MHVSTFTDDTLILNLKLWRAVYWLIYKEHWQKHYSSMDCNILQTNTINNSNTVQKHPKVFINRKPSLNINNKRLVLKPIFCILYADPVWSIPTHRHLNELQVTHILLELIYIKYKVFQFFSTSRLLTSTQYE